MERGGMRRLIFLGLTSTTASIGLAGCPANQDSEPGPDTTTEPATDTSTATDSPTETIAPNTKCISYTPQAVVTELDGTQRLALHVSGTATAVNLIQRIQVSVSGSAYSLPGDNGEFSKSGDEERGVDFAVYVPLGGGD